MGAKNTTHYSSVSPSEDARLESSLGIVEVVEDRVTVYTANKPKNIILASNLKGIDIGYAASASDIESDMHEKDIQCNNDIIYFNRHGIKVALTSTSLVISGDDKPTIKQLGSYSLGIPCESTSKRAIRLMLPVILLFTLFFMSTMHHFVMTNKELVE